MENKDYVLHVNWHSHRVGTLAWVDERFYLTQRKEKELKEARADGYDGIPGFDFKKNKIYQSGELFDCFLRKTLKKRLITKKEKYYLPFNNLLLFPIVNSNKLLSPLSKRKMTAKKGAYNDFLVLG